MRFKLNSKKTILIVDDDVELVSLMQELFESEGFKILTAYSGNQAIKVFESNRDLIDIIFSDIRMPDGDGVFLLKKIRQMSNPNPLVVLHSGYSEMTKLQAIELGAVNLIQKPADFKQLLSYLASL